MMGMKASVLHRTLCWVLAVTAVVLAATACTGVDDPREETAAEAASTTEAAVQPTTTAVPPTTIAAAMPVATTEAVGAEDGADLGIEAESEAESEPLLDEYSFDCGAYCLDETSGVVGVELAPGLWQWASNSRGNCVYIAVSPRPRQPDGTYMGPVDDRWWLDARGPVVLAEGETVLGFAPQPNHDELVIATNPVRCILERVGSYTSDIDIYAQRHESGDRGVVPDQYVEHDAADWKCYAHAQVGPEPATELDWQVSSFDDHPSVSCVVGEGIAAGWWRWQNPIGNCRFLVVEDADDRNHHRLRRIDASEPVELIAGESVRGYALSGDDHDPFRINTTMAECTLQYEGPDED